MVKKNEIKNDLLNKSKNERYDHFRNYTMNHTNLEKATKEVIERIKDPSGFSLFMVIGPSGVGKTTLLKKVKEIITKDLYDEIGKDRGRIPIVDTELISPTSRDFNWKDYFIRVLQELNEPMIKSKIDYDKYLHIPKEGRNKIKINYKETSPELMRSLENAFKYRKPIALLIDEAQHFTKLSKGNKLQNQLDAIKSIANITKVMHVLIGTYELIPFVDLSGQLSRRTVEVHFKRYDANNKKDVRNFQKIINTFQNKLPLRVIPDFISKWDYIYERTLGCVGILKNWLERSLHEALERDLDTIDYELLKKHALSINKIEKMLTEIEYGEDYLKEDLEKTLNVRSKLGLESSNKVSKNDCVKKEKKNNQVGIRNPNRDSVGMV